MNPAFSVIVFTLAAGAAQGLVTLLAIAVLAGVAVDTGLLNVGLQVATALLVVGLGASFLHLGRPERAWRAATMWRTSWLSREVIALPAFIGLVMLWWLALRVGFPKPLTAMLLPLAAIAVAALLWYCTAMIYACLRFVEEWAHPSTLVNFVLTGLSSGGLLAAALGAAFDADAFVRIAGPLALFTTLAAGVTRWLAVQRNRNLRHRSTLQSATGIPATRLVQTSMGMTGGSFNTREFFHRASLAGLARIRTVSFLFGYAMPSLLAAVALLLPFQFASMVSVASAVQASWWWFAVAVQVPGLVADRWYFFAQAKHPQNLYYQVVS